MMVKSKQLLRAAGSLLVAVLVITGCGQDDSAGEALTVPEAVAPPQPVPWDAFVERYIEEHLAAHPSLPLRKAVTNLMDSFRTGAGRALRLRSRGCMRHGMQPWHSTRMR